MAVLDAGPPDAGLDAGLDSGVDAALADYDGTDDLSDCSVIPERRRLCTTTTEHVAGRWRFRFECPASSVWLVDLDSIAPVTTLFVEGTTQPTYGTSETPGRTHRIELISREEAGSCVATVVALTDTPFMLSIEELEPALDAFGCEALCLSDSPRAVERGCDCAGTCHDACTDRGADCGLPCNRESPFYACPYLETDIEGSDDCVYSARDDGTFEHVGRCYRCGDGQQCCYSDGRDNGTGSFDICPPSDPGPNDPDPHGCSGLGEHCACDVTPLCGCMAESGELALCGECIGEGNLSLSCNAPGDDATFCERAAAAAGPGFSWCSILGDPARCFELPPGF